MASRSVALVNRLRLGEAPSAADCALAARLLSLDGAAGDMLELVEDLEKTATGEARRLRVRVALVAETARLLEHSIAETLSALTRYFAARAEVEADVADEVRKPVDDVDDDAAVDAQAAAESVTGSGNVAAGLADLAVPARVGEGLDLALAQVADDCRRYQMGLTDLLSEEPDVERALDFLSAVEADMGHALHAVLRADFSDGETPYHPGLADLASAALFAS